MTTEKPKTDELLATLRPLDKESSQIAETGYHAPTRNIVVRFHTGAVYRYDNCDAMLHDDMRTAESVGKFFNRYIKSKPDKYPYEKIVDPKPKEASK